MREVTRHGAAAENVGAAGLVYTTDADVRMLEDVACEPGDA